MSATRLQLSVAAESLVKAIADLDEVRRKVSNTPAAREISVAITNAETALLWANKAGYTIFDAKAHALAASLSCPVCDEVHSPVCNDDFPEPGDVRETGR